LNMLGILCGGVFEFNRISGLYLSDLMFLYSFNVFILSVYFFSLRYFLPKALLKNIFPSNFRLAYLHSKLCLSPRQNRTHGNISIVNMKMTRQPHDVRTSILVSGSISSLSTSYVWTRVMQLSFIPMLIDIRIFLVIF